MADVLRFTLRQHFALTVNRYTLQGRHVDGTKGSMTTYAQQNLLSGRQQVTFHTDEARTQLAFGFKIDRKHQSIGDTYDVTDDQGHPIGQFRKDFGRSLLRSTWYLSTPDGLNAVGRERSLGVAIARRVIDLLNGPPVAWRFHFDFVTSDEQIVLTSQSERAIRDRYDITIPVLSDGRQLDWRVGAAMAVALDALQHR